MGIKFLNSENEILNEYKSQDFESIKINKSQDTINLTIRKKWNETQQLVKFNDISDISALDIDSEIIQINVVSEEIYVHKVEDEFVHDTNYILEINYEVDFDE